MPGSSVRKLATATLIAAAFGLSAAAAAAGAPGTKDRHTQYQATYKTDRHRSRLRAERYEDPHHAVRHWRHRHDGERDRRGYHPYVKYPERPFGRGLRYWRYERPYRRPGAYAWISYDCHWVHRRLRARVWTQYGWEPRTVWRHVRVCR